MADGDKEMQNNTSNMTYTGVMSIMSLIRHKGHVINTIQGSHHWHNTRSCRWYDTGIMSLIRHKCHVTNTIQGSRHWHCHVVDMTQSHRGHVTDMTWVMGHVTDTHHVYICSSLAGVLPRAYSFRGWWRPVLQKTRSSRGHVYKDTTSASMHVFT